MIHKFCLDGYNIVVDIYSGAVHVLDEIGFKAVNYMENSTRDETVKKLSEEYGYKQAVEAAGEIEELIERGTLFTKNPYEGYWETRPKEDIVKSICLNIAHDCNLQCEYCFASKGDFGGVRILMPFDTAAKAIDFLLLNSGKRENLEVDFFGGEPLLNFDVIKQVISYAREKEKKFNKTIRFTITTNAVLLNEDKMEFINEHMDNIVLSIDGRKEINDRMRSRLDGRGTYDDIMPAIINITKMRKQKDYFVRGTFTSRNLDFSKDALHLADLGFKHVSLEPVVLDEDKENALKKEHLNIIFEEYEKLAREYIKRKREGKGFNFYHFEFDLDNGPCIAKRVKGCGAGEEYFAITPEGDIYPCHQFVGNREFIMGNVFEGTIDNQIRQKFKNTNIFTKSKCSDCWAKFYCSGGCAANAWQFNKDIGVPYEFSCELQKKRVECALMIKAALSEIQSEEVKD